MKKIFATGCVLLAACGSVQIQADAITPLEQACLRDPLDPDNWERLAAALAVAGERERAATMYQQAASLRAHDVRQDYAVLEQAREQAFADMPRTQLRRLGPALVEVVRTGASEAAAAPATLRLEISNGNGIAGAAARLARSLELDGMKTVRLSNMRPFVVPQSRIEYPREQHAAAQALARRLRMPLQQRSGGAAYADMRIVLGHDVRYLK
nr:LytR C-terminal domain-containing protein [uncultured Duganella sp.]